MKAVITGKNDERIGVNLLDNNNVEHVIEMEFDGEVKYHSQDGYPDKDVDRTNAERIAVKQADRFAKYHVYRERGYDTLERRQNPDRIAAVVLSLSRLSAEQCNEYVSELYEQLQSEYTQTQAPVDLPSGANTSNVVYQQDIYLSASHEETRGLADAFGTEKLKTAVGTPMTATGEASNACPSGGKTDGPSLEVADSKAVDFAGELAPSEWIDTVSGLRVRWDDAGTYRTLTSTEPDRSRGPDGRLELLPYEPSSVDTFQQRCLRGLHCQVRDCYLGMGLIPPEPFQIQGVGKHKQATWYEQLDIFQPYHDPTAEIDWTRL